MPNKATELSVLVGSPGDVTEERERLEQVVSSVNSAFAGTGISLRLIRWEHDVRPGLGEDAQAVVNDEIPEDYDVFIGIMWNSVGTPTGRAISGTIEEFEQAVERFDKDPSSIRVMMYFKDAVPMSMADIDPEQLAAVRAFRAKFKGMGLYKTFSSTDDFATAVQVHLTKLMLDQLPRDSGGGITLIATVPDESEPDEAELDAELSGNMILVEEEEGLLELQDTFEAETKALVGVLERMGEATNEVGDRMRLRNKGLQLIQGKVQGSQAPRSFHGEIKRQVAHAARDMDRFVNKMKAELPLYRQHLDRGMSTFVRLVPVSMQFEFDRDELARAGRRMLQQMDSMLESTEGFHDSVKGLPPLTSPLVRSKRATEGVLKQVIDISRGGRATLAEALSILE